MSNSPKHPISRFLHSPSTGLSHCLLSRKIDDPGKTISPTYRWDLPTDFSIIVLRICSSHKPKQIFILIKPPLRNSKVNYFSQILFRVQLSWIPSATAFLSDVISISHFFSHFLIKTFLRVFFNLLLISNHLKSPLCILM